MKSFQIMLNDPDAPEGHHKAIFVMVESPYRPDIEPILKRLNEVTTKPAEWKLHRTFIDGKEVEETTTDRMKNVGLEEQQRQAQQ